MEDLNEFKPFLAKAVNSVIPNMFEQVKGFNSETHIHAEDIIFVDSVAENAKATTFSFGALIFCVLATIFLLMIIISTAILM